MKTTILCLFTANLLFAICDWNEDNEINVLDIVATVNFILDSNGDPMCDWNEDGDINVLDIMGMINFMLVGPPDVFEMVDILPGVFTYGEYNQQEYIDYEYKLMKYEVTNLQYIAFLENAWENGDLLIDECYAIDQGDSCLYGYYNGDNVYSEGYYLYYAHQGENFGWNSYAIQFDGEHFSIDEGFENHPVLYVTWYGAKAFADFYPNHRLPSELEWEKAARGNTGWDYPWGNEIDGANANFLGSGDPWTEGTTPVGYYNGENGTIDSPSPTGAYDMAGNVWEWTSDHSQLGYTRARRGGSWMSYDGSTMSWRHGNQSPDWPKRDIGFRLVKDVP